MSRRGLYLPIIGDPTSFLRALRTSRLAAADFAGTAEKSGVVAAGGMAKASLAADALAVDMQKVSVAAERSVKVQAAAEAKRAARLRQEIVLFNEMAAAAKRGSDSQVLYSNLAGRSQRELAMAMGTSAKEAARLQHATGASNREINRGVRGALAGSGVFKALGRSLAFASGGFLIFASAASFLRNSVDAAREELKTRRSLSAQYRANKQDLSKYRGEIEDTIAKESQLGGYTRDELTKAFVVAYRQIGDTSKALRLTNDAAEAARGRNLPLWTTVLGLTKAYGGQTTALRRLGILIPAHTRGIAALEYVERKFKGQLLANTTAAERFHASLYNLEEGAGNVLLPTIARLQTKFAAWAGDTKNQVFVQQQLRQVLQGVGGSIEFVYRVASLLASVFGGWRNAIVSIAGAWLGFKVKSVLAAAAAKASNLRAAAASVKAWRAAGVGTSVSAADAAALQVKASTTAAAAAEAAAASALAASEAAAAGTAEATAAASAAQVASAEATAAAVVAANEAAAAATATAWKSALVSTGFGILVVAAGAAAALIFTHWSSVKSLFSSTDGVGAEVKALTQDFYDLARASGKAGELASARLQHAQAKVNVDQAQQALKQARAQEVAARGTKAHAKAVDELRLAQQQLTVSQGQLADAQRNTGSAAKQQTQQLGALVDKFEHVSAAIYVAKNEGAGVGGGAHGGKFTGAQRDTVQTYVKNLQDAIDKGVSPQVFDILRRLQDIALYTKSGRARKLTSRDLPTRQDVKFVVTTVLNDKGKIVDLAKLFAHGKTASLFAPAFSLLNPSGPKAPKPAPLGPVLDTSPILHFQTWLDKQFGLVSAIAGSTTGTADDLKVARAEQKAIRQAIHSHRLHGDELIAAYQELGNVNATIASNVKTAADFGSRFDRKFALAIAKASATAGGRDDGAIAEQARAWVRNLIASGKLHGQKLIDAYTELGDLNSQLASDVSAAAAFASRFDHKFALALAKASATSSGRDDLAIAKQSRAWVQAMIASGKLHGQQLIDAYSKLAELNGEIASATQSAGDKAKQARDQMRQNVEAAIGQIGALFAGPILAPTADQIKQQLGVLPPEASTLNRDLAAQNKYTKKWLADIHKLVKEGAPKQLIKELMAAGPAQAAYVHSLATASKKQLRQFFKEYQERVRLGQKIATVHLTSNNVDLIAHTVVFKGKSSGDGKGSGSGKGSGAQHAAGRRPDTTPAREGAARRAAVQGSRAVHISTGRAAIAVRNLTVNAQSLTVTGLTSSMFGHAPALGRMRLESGRAHPHASSLMPHMIESAGPSGDVILKLDSDVIARATLPHHQRRARRQIQQVRGRRGDESPLG